MHWKMVLPACLAAVMLLPAAQALSVSIDQESPITLPASAPLSVPFTVTVDCVNDVLLGLAGNPAAVGSYAVEVTLSGPSWVAAEPVTINVDTSACLTAVPDLAISEGGAINVAATPEAPGMTTQPVTLDANGAMATTDIQVEYVPGYMFMVDETFPLEVGHHGANFSAVIHQFANARSMAMFEILEPADCVAVSGLPEFYVADDTQLGGSNESMLPVTIRVTPRCEDWEEDTFTFKTWNHFLDDGAVKTSDQEITWTFMSAHDDHDESADSPGVGAVALFGLLAAAFVAVRRRQ